MNSLNEMFKLKKIFVHVFISFIYNYHFISLKQLTHNNVQLEADYRI